MISSVSYSDGIIEIDEDVSEIKEVIYLIFMILRLFFKLILNL